jgi:GGDEF domain-containing protein
MSAAVMQLVEVGTEPLQGLLDALGVGQHIEEALEAAWRWFNEQTPVDVVAAAMLGPDEPAVYVLTSAVVDADGRDRLLAEISAAAARVSPGMYPRRMSDMRLWAVTECLHPIESPTALVGQWSFELAGAPAALVRLSRFEPGPTDPRIAPLLGTAAHILSLHVRALQAIPWEPTEVAKPSTFEALLESQVAIARRVRLPVSLALVEVDRAAGAVREGSLTEQELTDIEDAMRRVLRHRDRVQRISANCIAVVMPRTDARGALVGADRLQGHLREHFRERRPNLSFHVGIGGRDPDETEASELFARAAQALSQARLAHSETAFVYV